MTPSTNPSSIFVHVSAISVTVRILVVTTCRASTRTVDWIVRLAAVAADPEDVSMAIVECFADMGWVLTTSLSWT
jgi:hypothetical protein